MSIINDALKKAGRIGINIKTDTKRSSTSTKKWLIWTGAGILCLLGLFLVINSFKESGKYVSLQEMMPETESSKSVFNLRGIDIESPLRVSGFRLSGILYDNQKPMAIINNRIVEEGALINGAQLLEIQPNYVRLSLKGEELQLKIK